MLAAIIHGAVGSGVGSVVLDMACSKEAAGIAVAGISGSALVALRALSKTGVVVLYIRELADIIPDIAAKGNVAASCLS